MTHSDSWRSSPRIAKAKDGKDDLLRYDLLGGSLARHQFADSSARSLLERHSGEEFVVPCHAAGEFLEGGATISEARLAESLRFLRLFRIGDVTIETALRYARIVSHLRSTGALTGRSKPDLWIAAWAAQNAAPLATRNAKHFDGIPGLELLPY